MTQFWSQKAEILARYLKCQLVFSFKRATPLDPPPKGAPGGEGLEGARGSFQQWEFQK